MRIIHDRRPKKFAGLGCDREGYFWKWHVWPASRPKAGPVATVVCYQRSDRSWAPAVVHIGYRYNQSPAAARLHAAVTSSAADLADHLDLLHGLTT